MPQADDFKHRQLIKSIEKMNKNLENINVSIKKLTFCMDSFAKATKPYRRCNEDNTSNDMNEKNNGITFPCAE